MLDIGSFLSHDCVGVSRRAFVRAAACAPLALGLPSIASGSADRPTGQGRAKSVIMIWLWGGPSQLDTFDPKPKAQDQYRGPFRPIATKTSGVQFSELLPRLAARSDRFAVIRSTYYDGADHHMLPLTGHRNGNEPNFGSIVAKRIPGRNLPPFVSIAPRTKLRHKFMSTSHKGYGAGRLGAAYNPFLIRCSADGKTNVESIKLLAGLTPDRLADRHLLRGELDRARRRLDSAPEAVFTKQLQSADSLLSGRDAQIALDLSRESETVRDAYGHTTFGQSMLLARRLVEAQVPYIHVNWSLGVDALAEGANMGWDTHRNGFEQLMTYHCPVFDRAFSALLDDLHQRGLLDSTLIVGTGEMGRTPKINNIGGRDHWPACSTFWAGAGVQGGRIVGKTDKIGGKPVTEPITPLMMGTTIVDCLGIDASARLEMGVLSGSRVIHELF